MTVVWYNRGTMRDNKRSAVIAIVATATITITSHHLLPLDGITQERGKIKMDEKERDIIVENDNVDQGLSVPSNEDTQSPEQKQQEVEGTTAATVEDGNSNSPAPVAPSTDEASEPADPQPVEQTFTQSRVNELVGRARQEGRESALKELFNRYGVNSDEEMNEVFGRGQAYDGLNDEYSAVQSSYNDLRTENALLRSEVAPERYEDVKLILGGKGMDVTVENIAMMLPSHPEWKGGTIGVSPANTNTPDIAPQPATSLPNGTPVQPTAQIRQLSTDATPEPVESDEDKAMKLYGL